MDDEVLFEIPFYTEEVQSFAEANFGKRLGKRQLNRIQVEWPDYVGEVRWKLDEVMSTVIEGCLGIKPKPPEPIGLFGKQF